MSTKLIYSYDPSDQYSYNQFDEPLNLPKYMRLKIWVSNLYQRMKFYIKKNISY